MRILQVTEASTAGTLRIVEILSDGMTRRGHEVVLAHGRRPETPDTIGAEYDGAFQLEELDWDRRTAGAQVRAFGQLRRLVRQVQPDVIHLHSAFAGLVGGSLDDRHPRVFTPHGWASTTTRDWRVQRVLGSFADRFAIQRSELVGVVSHSEADTARAMGARRLTVVANGLPELDAPPPLPGHSSADPVVVAGGRLVASRRPVETAGILHALRDIAETGWIGDGHPATVAKVQALGVGVTGWLPHREAVIRIAAADAYLHWSDCDGQSVAVLEAMAHGVVVIASDIPPNRELLDRSQLFAHGDDAAAMIRRVLASPELRDQIIASQRRRGSTHGANRMVDAWIDAYEQVGSDHAQSEICVTGRSFTFGLLAILVAAMPWDDALHVPSDTVSIVKLLGVAVGLAWIATMAGRSPLVLAPTLLPLVVFDALLVASLLASGDVGLGLPHLLRYASFAALFFLITQIVQNRTQVIVLLGVLTGSSAVASAVGLGRFFAAITDRAAGPIADANDFAYVLATVLPFGVYLIVRGGRARPAWVLATVVIAAAILGTLSRGAIVGLVVAAAWVAVQGRVRLRTVALTVLAIGVIAGAAFAFQRDFVEDRLYAKNLVAGDNIDSRRALWQGALDMAADHPVLGVGTGLYRYRAAEYVIDDPLQLVEPVAHNAYVEVLAENGVLALLALAAFIVGTWLLVRTSRRDAVDGQDLDAELLATALQASFITAVVGAAFLSVLVTPPIWFVGAVVASLASIGARASQDERVTSPS